MAPQSGAFGQIAAMAGRPPAAAAPFAWLLAAAAPPARAANPIVAGVGMADPHMHVWPADPSR
eukprot:gene16794-8585_t